MNQFASSSRPCMFSIIFFLAFFLRQVVIISLQRAKNALVRGTIIKGDNMYRSLINFKYIDSPSPFTYITLLPVIFIFSIHIWAIYNRLKNFVCWLNRFWRQNDIIDLERKKVETTWWMWLFQEDKERQSNLRIPRERKKRGEGGEKEMDGWIDREEGWV